LSYGVPTLGWPAQAFLALRMLEGRQVRRGQWPVREAAPAVARYGDVDERVRQQARSLAAFEVRMFCQYIRWEGAVGKKYMWIFLLFSPSFALKTNATKMCVSTLGPKTHIFMINFEISLVHPT
jgi:hypothetical protein